MVPRPDVDTLGPMAVHPTPRAPSGAPGPAPVPATLMALMALLALLALTACSPGSSGPAAGPPSSVTPAAPAASSSGPSALGPSASGSAAPDVAATGPSSSAPSASKPSASGQAGAMAISVRVDGRTVTPPPRDVPVRRGTPVRLTVESAGANALHVHGLDLERDLPAGTAVSLDLRFADPGVYEVETHEPELRLLRFVVR